MTQEEILKELKELGNNWENYLANTSYEIKHQRGADGKTDIFRRYNAMIQRTQELCRLHCNGA